MSVRVRVVVMPRRDILDPQGEAVGKALHGLGYAEVKGARIGKVVALELEAPAGSSRAQLTARAEEMARKLLANPVVEDFALEWPDDDAGASSAGWKG
jgi:phosphoribosylformylglycinamidine synthase